MVSTAIAAAPRSTFPVLGILPFNAYAVPRIDTVATTTAVIRFVHHGVSGYNDLGLGTFGVPFGVLIVYFKRLVLLSMNNNG